MKTKHNKLVYRLILSSMFLALAIVLPFFVGQIPEIGGALCPMHIPVILCGFFCGPWFGMLVGFIAPLLRSIMFSSPPLLPTAISMCFELATYGFVSAMMYKLLPKKNVYTILSLIISMIAGRVIFAVIRLILLGVASIEFSFKILIYSTIIQSIPGIILQIIIIPILVNSLKKYTYSYNSKL